MSELWVVVLVFSLRRSGKIVDCFVDFRVRATETMCKWIAIGRGGSLAAITKRNEKGSNSATFSGCTLHLLRSFPPFLFPTHISPAPRIGFQSDQAFHTSAHTRPVAKVHPFTANCTERKRADTHDRLLSFISSCWHSWESKRYNYFCRLNAIRLERKFISLFARSVAVSVPFAAIPTRLA